MTDKPMRWMLRRRLAIAFAIFGCLLLIGVTAATVAGSWLISANSDLVDKVSPARIRSATLGQVYRDQQLAVRDYVLTGGKNHQERFDAEHADEIAGMQRLQELLIDHPDLLSRINNVRSAARQWQEEIVAPAITQVQANGPDGALLARFDTTETRFVALQAALQQLDSAVNELRTDGRTATHQALGLLAGIGVAFVLGSLISALILWWALRRWITDPLKALGQETAAAIEGDLGRQIAEVGPQEIAELASHIEAMRGRLFAALVAALRVQETLQEQAHQLNEQADDLRRSNAELEQFAYVASHDLQEPLRKVASFCQMLQRRYGGQLDERADQYIEFAVDGAKRMQQLINDMLAFSRVGRTTGEFAKVDLNIVAHRALTSLTAAREETGAIVNVVQLPTVLGNATLLTQVFQNIIGNAIKFRSQVKPIVTITAAHQGESWLFRCEDNGIGIDPQYSEKIFIMFQRLHPKDSYVGTGIGLALCKKIIEHHGGQIWLDTEVTQGTAVCWTLPAIGTHTSDKGKNNE